MPLTLAYDCHTRSSNSGITDTLRYGDTVVVDAGAVGITPWLGYLGLRSPE